MKDGISVVIPTRGRPSLVCRAVKSALVQTHEAIEVIAVIDGPDEATLRALEGLNDPRVRILVLPENVGPSNARNVGVREAKEAWVAFLDDDDEWLPFKLEEQLGAANRAEALFPVIASYFIVRSLTGDVIRPGRMVRPDEAISEYLFYRSSVFQKEGFLLTSTLLMKKELLEKTPFRGGLKRHEDWDVLLRAARLDGVCFEVIPKPLAIWHREESEENHSSAAMWRSSLEWIRENRDLVTPRAYAGFLSTVVADQASRQKEWRAFVPLLREMCRDGTPKMSLCLLYLVMWFTPKNMRRRVRSLLWTLITANHEKV